MYLITFQIPKLVNYWYNYSMVYQDYPTKFELQRNHDLSYLLTCFLKWSLLLLPLKVSLDRFNINVFMMYEGFY